MRRILNVTPKLLLFLLCWLAFLPSAQAQFTLRQAFNDDVKSSDIVIGGGSDQEQGKAYLTSGLEDPVNAGWLRLTKDAGYQRGYAFINRTFPSTMGVLIDFEYKAWRVDGTAGAGDGFSVFLFDGTVDENSFRIGGYGGSLGYAPLENTAGDVKQQGLKGGYIGIGFDAHGNFANVTEGRRSGLTARRPNSIVLRGPTIEQDFSNPERVELSNEYLGGVTLVDGLPPQDIELVAGDKTQSELQYNEATLTRPDDATFYRRVQIEVVPIKTSNSFQINVRWQRQLGGSFVELFSSRTEHVPPQLLKLGFAASTGSAYNNHDIRNLSVTTPGNLRVTKVAEKDILRANQADSAEDEFTYILEVNNDTDADLPNIEVKDWFTDADNNPIPEGAVHITNISFQGEFLSTSLPVTPSMGNPITSGTLAAQVGLGAKKEGKILVKGTLMSIPSGNLLVNTVEVDSKDITDEDPENNLSFVKTPVYAEGVDLIVDVYTGSTCLDEGEAKEFDLVVSNIGDTDATYDNLNSKVVVQLEKPVGSTVKQHVGWDLAEAADSYTFSKIADAGDGRLVSGASLPPITLSVTSESVYSVRADVSLLVTDGVAANIEPDENTDNNIGSVLVELRPEKPKVEKLQYYYCQNDEASPLEATATDGHTLVWYRNVGGVPLSNAPTPNTETPGVTTFYLGQSNGSCESELQAIEVRIMSTPTAGNISLAEDEFCLDVEVALSLNSDTPGSVDEAATLEYRWESSLDGKKWNVLAAPAEETSASYNFDHLLIGDTWFRRVTVSKLGDVECRVTTDPVLVKALSCLVRSNRHIWSKGRN